MSSRDRRAQWFERDSIELAVLPVARNRYHRDRKLGRPSGGDSHGIPLGLGLGHSLRLAVGLSGNWRQDWETPDIGESRKEPNGPNLLAGIVYGLVSLLLSFSFGIAMQRFDARRHLVVDEANAVGSAYLRADLLKVWFDVISAFQRDPHESTRIQLTPAIDSMFDFASIRDESVDTRIPWMIYFLLGGVSLASALLASRNLGARPTKEWGHRIVFSAVLATVMFVGLLSGISACRRVGMLEPVISR